MIKTIVFSATSWLGLLLYFSIIIKKKFELLFEIIYGQIVKYSFSSPFPQILFAKRPIDIVNGKQILIGNRIKIGKHTIISAWNVEGESNIKIVIGDNVYIGSFNHITAIKKITINEGTLIGKFVTITDNSHGKNPQWEKDKYPINRELYSKGEVIIGKNVWIGDKVTILPGINIGDGSIVGANSVVTKNVPPFSIVCGNPAVIIRKIK